MSTNVCLLYWRVACNWSGERGESHDRRQKLSSKQGKLVHGPPSEDLHIPLPSPPLPSSATHPTFRVAQSKHHIRNFGMHARCMSQMPLI